MNQRDLTSNLRCAMNAARAAGQLMRQNLRENKVVNSSTQHDIKLELDVRCQKLVEKYLSESRCDRTVLGEEGITGDPAAETRWVVDPIDGTVNFTYGIPHACVSIALQRRCQLPVSRAEQKRHSVYADGYQTLLGVVYDPFCDEIYSALAGKRARLNGRPIHVSSRRRLAECIISLGFAKDGVSLNRMLPAFNRLIRRVRKVRMMGAAALGIAYVAAGRMDAYFEHGLRLWDIAAGGLLVEAAGGNFWREPTGSLYTYRILANNGFSRPQLAQFLG